MTTSKERFADYYDSRSHREVVELLIEAEDEAERIEREIRDLHEPFPIFPVVDTRFIDDNCPHCGENVDDTYRDLHDEDSEGSQYVLCLTNGPDYLVCRECSNDGADEVSYPCNTLKIFGIKE